MTDFEKKTAEAFFNEFFTQTERIMFAKRLAVLFLIREGITPYRIARLLNVSTSTVYRLEKQFGDTEQHTVAALYKKLDTKGGLFDELRTLLLEGFSMDPKRRSKWLNEFEKRYG